MINAEIGERLRLIRVHRKLTQVQVAAFLNARSPKISEIETGKRGICCAELSTLHQNLRFDLNVFFDSQPFDVTRCLLP